MPRTLPNQKITAHVERLNSAGQGIAALDGLTLFIDGALPSETVEAELQEIKKNYAKAKLCQILEKSPARTSPPCPHYENCGGCQIMHLKYAAQLEFKRSRVQETLSRIGRFPASLPIEPCLAAPHPFHYRNKLQFNAGIEKGRPHLGFFQRGSHKIENISVCHVHLPLGNMIYQTVKNLLTEFPLEFYDESSDKGYLRHILIRSSESPAKSLVIFVTRRQPHPLLRSLATQLMRAHQEIIGVLCNINPLQGNTILGKETILLAGQDHLSESFLGFKFKISAASFFQVNTLQAENLFRLAISQAKLSKNDRVLDAYCGTGALSLALAQAAHSVIGIESNAIAIRNARENAQTNNIQNIQFIEGKTEDLLNDFPGFDCVFLDPPRKGCDPKFLNSLMASPPSKIIYISCDPATLARDLHILCQGPFVLEKAQPVDMFPQTTHIETIAFLTRKMK